VSPSALEQQLKDCKSKSCRKKIREKISKLNSKLDKNTDRKGFLKISDIKCEAFSGQKNGFQEIYVDPYLGNDANSGLSKDAAFLTLDEALKSAKKSIASNPKTRINLSAGDYYSSETIKINSALSPVDGGLLVIKGEDGTDFVRSTKIKNWTKKKVYGRNVAFAKLPEGVELRQAFFGSRKLKVASNIPKVGTLPSVDSLNGKSGSINVPKSSTTNWLDSSSKAEVSSVDIVVPLTFSLYKFKLKSVSKSNSGYSLKLKTDNAKALSCVVITGGRRPKYCKGTEVFNEELNRYDKLKGVKAQFYFENHPSFIQNVGDFAIVDDDGIYLLPPKGVSINDLNNTGLDLPFEDTNGEFQPLFSIVGARNVQIENVGFKYMGWNRSEIEGILSNASGKKFGEWNNGKRKFQNGNIPSALEINKSSNVALVGNTFSHLDSVAVSINNSEKILVEKNLFDEISYAGVTFSNGMSYNFSENILTNIGTSGVGDALITIQTRCANIDHNSIVRVARAGIKTHGDQLKNNISYQIKISNNLVDQALAGGFEDQGAIYTSGAGRQKVRVSDVKLSIVDNLVSNVKPDPRIKTSLKSGKGGGSGIYLDLNSRGVLVKGNEIRNVPNALNQNCGSYNEFTNNKIVNARFLFNHSNASPVPAEVLSGCGEAIHGLKSILRDNGESGDVFISHSTFKGNSRQAASPKNTGVSNTVLNYWKKRGLKL